MVPKRKMDSPVKGNSSHKVVFLCMKKIYGGGKKNG